MVACFCYVGLRYPKATEPQPARETPLSQGSWSDTEAAWVQPDAEHSTLARVSDEDTRTRSYPPSTETGGGASEGHPCIVAETDY